MKKVILMALALTTLMSAAELKKVSFDEYLSKFDYKERENMKTTATIGTRRTLEIAYCRGKRKTF